MRFNVLEWLEHTSKKMPDKMALWDEEEQLTYKEYHDKSIGIADAIIKTGYGTKKPIAVYIEKSAKVLASFMGVAYSGNFYSPIDTEMPEARVNKILEVLRPGLVITTRKLAEEFKSFDYHGKFLFYEETDGKEESQEVRDTFNSVIDTDLLYVLFTSGSTGVPKGVCITHGSVIDYIDWVTETFGITDKDAFGNQAPFYFDNSILDIYSAMKTGASLYIVPQKLFSQPVLLLEYLKEHRINTIFWVPSALIVVSKLKALRNVDMTGVLKRVLFCGEVMPNKQLNIWRKFLPDVIYANLYGPTEITDACTYYIVDREFGDDEPLPMGFPMKNTDILVLDEEDHLVLETGVVGELCVRGVGLAKGYYRNREKTQVAFVQNPLNDAYEEKIYRTGDLVKYNERHELVYLSRKDFQIKHMGHRIELGEIETAVSSLPGVSLCCCLYDDKRSRIVLFIDKEIKKDEVNEQLKTMIPEYMLPGKVIIEEKMPINANGKIDRVRLKEYL
ncbi:MAG: amino acid adenylation domain-containing protein [Lachnospiraceae bacterium]|nr:amino acid adenylation domain-containing protein [Lachnospiraceae bacterium]